MTDAEQGPATVRTSGPVDRDGRPPGATRAIAGGTFGFFVDMYDVYLPTIALTPALSYFTPTSVSSSTRAVVAAMVFVATLVGRPLGAVFFGRLADHIGRKRVTLTAVAGCGIATLLIAVLPGYSTWGLTAVGLLIALRLVDGAFLGGEYTGAIPLALEYAGTRRRGLYGSLVGMGFPLAYCAISLVTFIVEQFVSTGGPTSAYSEWGWRIPFAVGALLCAVFYVYYARNVEESPLWKAGRKRQNPLRTVVLGPYRRNFWQVATVMVGVWFASNMASALLPSTLATRTTLTATDITGVLVIAQAIHALLFPAFGAFVDRYGRRPFLIGTGVTVGIGCAGLFAFFASGVRSGLLPLFFVVLAVRIFGVSMFAITPSYICERFPSAVRGSGFGLGYSLPLLATAGYVYYQEWLAHLMPMAYTPVVLLVLGGVLIVVGMLFSPETKDIDLDADPSTWVTRPDSTTHRPRLTSITSSGEPRHV